MIIIRVSGGLGNQMFQYALGRALTLESGAELVLDDSSYSMQKPGEAARHFALDRFRISGRMAQPSDFKELGVPSPSDQSFMAKVRRRMSRRVVYEPMFAFIPDMLGIRDNAYIAGVWQSEKYFKAHEDQIRRDITLKDPLSKEATDLIASMKEGSSVAIHVRRGDQVSDPRLLAKHGALSQSYYSSAIAYIKSKIANPRLYIFSDETGWVKENMDFGPEATYISETMLQDYEALIAMSSCAHQIIAKSTFSWWAAWLNPDPDKIVIAPKQRFATERDDDKDLIPDEWVKL